MNTRSVALCFNDNAEHIVFQVNPAQLSLSRPNRNQSFDLALGGSINLWGGRGLRQVHLSTFLPHEGSPFSSGSSPDAVLATLRRWQDSGSPVRLVLSDSEVNDSFLIEDIGQTFRE